MTDALSPRGLTVGALVLGGVALVGTGAGVWNNLNDRRELTVLAVWKRPLVFGIDQVPLNIVVFAALLLLIARFVGRQDRLSRISAAVVLAAGAFQATLALGYWIVLFTVSDPAYARFSGGRRQIGVGDLIYRVPQLTLTLVAIAIAWTLLRSDQPVE